MTFIWQRLTFAVVCGLFALTVVPATSSAAVLSPGFYPNLNASLSANSKANKDQSVVIGSIAPLDRLLLQETAYKESIWMIVRDADIVYPKKNEIAYKISCIKVLDQRLDGNNGVVKVKEGGIGSSFAKLRFHSQRGHSLNYVVQIYGH